MRKTNYINLLSLLIIATCFIIAILKVDIEQSTPTSAQEPMSPTLVPANTTLEDWQDILRPSENCLLPCLWGLIPGKTTLPEVAFTLFQNFEGVRVGNDFFLENNSLLTTTFFYDFEGTERLFETQFHFRNRTLEFIFIRYNMKFDSTIEAMNYFSIRNLVQEYGVPDSIRIQANASNEGLVANHLQFYWRDIGLYVYYDRCEDNCEDFSNTSSSDVCFQLSNLSTLTVGLYDPAAAQTLEDLMTQQRYESEVIEILGLTNQEFIDLIVQENYCLPFDLPISSDD